ncbi:very short patch repair endonuclease [Luteolibacter sp. GHJ8]|uniref:Very short patch repair endonuclease n=1 Tax=Luteolibacter rhizosphaerae TaxID=2989719 RepID=A0ABT3G4F2_9BACT|nr:very short patch repair endonuclease [Luteolibacter rhizosphaerae]MCW1914703.1 very short patch repair endonuclease [Luteolibacter rhizosphaerae]
MADIWSAAKRSEVMSRIRGGDTKPELLVRSMLHRLGYRFTIHGPKNKSLPGHPDLVLPKYQVVIFVHGCFWHGHEHCPDFKMPKSKTEWWTAKIEGNRARDARVESELRSLGWHVVTLWACAVKTRSAREWLESRLPVLIGKPPSPASEVKDLKPRLSARVAEDPL